MFAGEAWENGTGLYYNRARWLDVGTGRFVSEDVTASKRSDPKRIHGYLYAKAEPVTNVDPTGYDFGLASLSMPSISFGSAFVPTLGKSQGASGRFGPLQRMFADGSGHGREVLEALWSRFAPASQSLRAGFAVFPGFAVGWEAGQ